MKNGFKSIAAIVVIAAIMVSNSLFAQYSKHKGTINAVIGDVSYTEKFNTEPEESDEITRIRTHLIYVEQMLKKKDVSDLSLELRAVREKNIERLHDYRMRGQFPTNYDYPGERRPCFIDKNGTVCALGYVVMESGHKKEAEYIASVANYEYVEDMDILALDTWIARSGLTEEECAMIQPAYQFLCTDNDPSDGVCLAFRNQGLDDAKGCRIIELESRITDPLQLQTTHAFKFFVDGKFVACVVTDQDNAIVTVCLSEGEVFKVEVEGTSKNVGPRTVIMPPQANNQGGGNYGCNLPQSSPIGSEEKTAGGGGIIPCPLAGIDQPFSPTGTGQQFGEIIKGAPCPGFGKRSLSDNAMDENGVLNIPEPGFKVYPNPSYGKTTVEFTLPVAEKAMLVVFDVTGAHVATLFDGTTVKGKQYVLEFDATNLSDGVYFYRFESNSGIYDSSGKMMIK